MSNLRRSLRIARKSETTTSAPTTSASVAPITGNTKISTEPATDIDSDTQLPADNPEHPDVSVPASPSSVIHSHSSDGMKDDESVADIHIPTTQSRSSMSGSGTTEFDDEEVSSSSNNAARISQDRASSSDIDLANNEEFVAQYDLVWCRDIRDPEADLLGSIGGNMGIFNEDDVVPIESSAISPTPEPPQDSNDAEPIYLSLPGRDKASMRLTMTASVMGEDIHVNFTWDYKPRYTTHGRPVYTKSERSGREDRERENSKTIIERMGSSRDENRAIGSGQDQDPPQMTIVDTQLRDRNNILFVEWHMDCPSFDRNIIGFMKKDSSNTGYGANLSANERSRIDVYFANLVGNEPSDEDDNPGPTAELDQDAPVWYTESMRILQTL